MKGQMFIIAGLIVVVAIVALRNSLSLESVLENQRHLEQSFDTLTFSNIRSEMTRTLDISYNSPSNMTGNLNNFDSFVRGSLETRTVEFNSLLIETYYPTLNPGANTTFNVTVNNNLGNDIQFMNITFNGTSQTFSVMNGNIALTSFTISSASSFNQTMTVFYNTSSTSQTENIPIPLSVGHSVYTAFFDIRYISSLGQQSDKFTDSLTLS